MSELSETGRMNKYHVNISVWEPRDKFGGLSRDVAMQQASECLDGEKLRTVQCYLGGMSLRAIGPHLGLDKRKVALFLEEAKEDVARFHLANWAPQDTESLPEAV